MTDLFPSEPTSPPSVQAQLAAARRRYETALLAWQQLAIVDELSAEQIELDKSFAALEQAERAALAAAQGNLITRRIED